MMTIEQQAACYRWFRQAYVDFDDDDVCNEALKPLGLCYTPEEVDEAINGELRKPENAHLLSARAGDGNLTGWKLVPIDPTMEMVNAFHTTQDSASLARGYCRARWDAMLAAAPQPSAKLEDFCGVMQEVREAETARGTKHRIAKWTCPKCNKACSTLELDGEWCHGDGLCISFVNGERIVGCTSCWLAAAPAATPAWQPIETAPKDGRDLLLWESGSSVPVVASWRDGRRPGWHASQEHYNTDGDACVVDTLWQDGITHWMPIPAAPEIASPATVSGSQP